MGLSASKEQQGRLEPADDLAQCIFHGTALDFNQLPPPPPFLIFCKAWGWGRKLPKMCAFPDQHL